MKLCDVALPIPLPRALSYEVTSAIEAELFVGARVVVKLGNRRVVGVAVAIRDGEPPPGVKPIVSVLDGASLPEDLLGFVQVLADYYFAPIGEAVRLALPPDDRAAKEGGGIQDRHVQWARATASFDEKAEAKLTANARALLADLRVRGEAPLARLASKWSTAPRIVAKLADLGLAALERRAVARDPFFAEAMLRDEPPQLTEAQRAAIEVITSAGDEGKPATFLLHGVTGSGKTEVYLAAIAHAKRRGRGSLLLVPEIALTPQLVSRFRARFGDEVAVLHSGLTGRERFDMWHRLRRGEVDVAIGARSALFAPIERLGLVLVDEEHDSSFKQEEGVRYHARDMAILRAHRQNAVVVLGSATPSLESVHLAERGKATRLRLPERAKQQAMPRVQIVDLRRTGPGPTGDRRLSLPLHRALEEVLAAGEQAILFLNRRGFAPSVRCEACGTLVSCPSCSVALTMHRLKGRGSSLFGDENELRCHYCDYVTALPTACTACKSPKIIFEGLGTEKLEETLSQAFPTARIARLDRDVASGRAVENVLDKVRAREIDILVGTQMVAKGHDLPHVTLVGVINADAPLSIPDFRAAERAFQLFVQVAGRAGRGDLPGRVFVQTFTPEHHAVALAMQHDVEGFLERELADRRELGYPPFTRAALLRVDAVDEEAAKKAAMTLAEACRVVARDAKKRLDVLGPAPAPLARLRNRYRYRVMLRAEDRADLRRALIHVLRVQSELPRTVRAVIDVDPVQLL